MNKFIKYYLYILPFYSLLSIVLGILRTAFFDSYVQVYLIVGAIFDLIIILLGWRCLLKKAITALIVFLFLSFFIGFFNNNELSSRFISDFTNPLFFFSKIFIFKEYWLKNNFKVYIKYYSKIAFAGSILLLPVTYFFFKSQNATRLAIFPPMELPFANFLVTNGVLLIPAFLIIFLYGKRAQLVSAIVTFLLYIFFLRKKEFAKYFILLLLGMAAIFVAFNSFSDNLAVRRLSYTIELFNDNKNGKNLNNISAGRVDEISAITRTMDFKDYIIGKGLGFTYFPDVGEIDVKTQGISNAHFSPIGFVSKYGVFFTIFLYSFLFSLFTNTKKALLKDHNYIIALGIFIMIFVESFFAYAMFVVPLFPIVSGVILASKERYRKQSLRLRYQKLTS